MRNLKKRFLSGIIAGTFILMPGLNGKIKNVKAENIKPITEIEDELNYDNKLSFYEYSNIYYNEINKLGVTESDVNFRLGPDSSYESFGKIKKGEVVNILYKSSNNWYLIDYKGELGFISTEYSKIIDFNKLEEEISALPRIINVVEATDDVNIRELPSTKAKKLGLLKTGYRLYFLREVETDWIEVTNGNAIGYVNKNYVKVVYDIEGSYYKNIYMTNDTKVYDYPYAATINILPKYETAFVYGETEDFYLIKSEKTVGFIKKIDTNNLNGVYVVVDISSQKIKLYNGIEEILSGNVVTGKNLTPSDLGDFKISEKQENYILKGADYEVKVDYWIRYNNGEGIHDASWRYNNFGGDIYKEKGSHGCINCPNNIVEKIYEETSIGDKVLVKK